MKTYRLLWKTTGQPAAGSDVTAHTKSEARAAFKRGGFLELTDTLPLFAYGTAGWERTFANEIKETCSTKRHGWRLPLALMVVEVKR